MKQWIATGVSLVALAIMSIVQAQESDWRISDAQNAADLFETEAQGVSLSPDGAILAGLAGDAICILLLSTDEETCYPLPDGFRGGLWSQPEYNPLAWSPDGTQIAFTEDYYRNLYESDIWVLDTTSGDYSNRTDDGVEGNFLGEEREDMLADSLLDYFPTFAPNGDLYFFRSEWLGDSMSNSTLTLQRLPEGEDTAELIANLTAALPPLSVYYAPVVSPDGAQIVFPVIGADLEDARNGLWLVDLSSGEASQLTDAGDGLVGMPEDRMEPMNPLSPAWLPDGTGIVFKTYTPSGSLTELPWNYAFVDITSADVKPPIDLSDFPPPSEALQTGADSYSAYIRMPYDGAVSADGSAFVYLRFDTASPNAQIALVPLPPDGSEAEVIGDFEFAPSPYIPHPMMSADGKALLGGWLFTFSEQ